MMVGKIMAAKVNPQKDGPSHIELNDKKDKPE
jgi:hypothetical protein